MSTGRPKSIGRYEPAGVLLRGYLGTLFDGTVREGDDAGQPVSIRLVTRELLNDDDRDRIATSARVFAGMRHESLVAFRDVVDGDQFAVVSDRFDGDGMRTLLRQLSVKRSLVSIGVALRIARDILTSIDTMHERAAALTEVAGRGYGGLTPDSFIVDQDGRTRLIEPGVECAVSRSEGWAKHSKRLGYDAPEIFDDADPTASADIFTAAAITWEILLNKRLLPGTSFEVVARRWKSGDLPRADAQKRLGKDDTPKALADVLARGLDLDPAGRYASARDMLDGLAALDLPLAEHSDVTAMVSGLAIRKPRSLRPPPGQVAGYVPRMGTMMGVGPKDRAQIDAAKPVVVKPATKEPQKPAATAPAKTSPARGPKGAAAEKSPPKRALPQRSPLGAGEGAARKPPPRRKPAPPTAASQDEQVLDELSVSDMTTHHSSLPPGGEADVDVPMDADEPNDAGDRAAASGADDSPAAADGPATAAAIDEPVAAADAAGASDVAEPEKRADDAGDAPEGLDVDAPRAPVAAAPVATPAGEPKPPAAEQDDDAEMIAALDPGDALEPRARSKHEDDDPQEDSDDDAVAAAPAAVPEPKASPKKAPDKDAPKAVAADADETSSSKMPVIVVVAAAAAIIGYVMFAGGDDPGDAPTTTTTAARTTTQAALTTTEAETTTAETTTEETTTSESLAEEEADAGAEEEPDAGEEASDVAAKSAPPAPAAVTPRPRPAPRPAPKPKPKKGFVPDDI